MKKQIFKRAFIVVIVLTSLIFCTEKYNAQIDSVGTEIVSDTTGISNEIQTVLLPSIFNLLGSFGVHVTPFAGLITFLVMLIIRRWEKRKSRKRHTQVLRDVIEGANAVNTMPKEFKEIIVNAINKIEKKNKV